MSQHKDNGRFHDAKLIERARLQWLCGDWESLAKLANEDITQHRDRNELSLFALVALIQNDQLVEARRFFFQIDQAEGAKLDAFIMFVGGVHNTLGRANSLLGNRAQARSHYREALDFAKPGCDMEQSRRIRETEQLAQLGMPTIWSELPDQVHPKAQSLGIQFLQQAKHLSPQEPSILIALAESAQRQEEYGVAIRYWQELAALLQESMPQVYYDRLDEAYQQQQSFPLGAPEEEQLRGEGDKHALLKELHRLLKPKKYLEVGVQTGKSFLLAECEAIGIDPMPRPNIKLRDNHTLLRMTSDEFFANHADTYLSEPPDLVFIDGMHLFEFALRDFINVERYSSKDTVIVIDDIFPGHPAQAERDRRTRAWTGDVWKLLIYLEVKRPDLELIKLDVYPTGVLIIKNADSEHGKTWASKFDSFFKDYAQESFDRYVVKRTGAIGVAEFLQIPARKAL